MGRDSTSIGKLSLAAGRDLAEGHHSGVVLPQIALSGRTRGRFGGLLSQERPPLRTVYQSKEKLRQRLEEEARLSEVAGRKQRARMRLAFDQVAEEELGGQGGKPVLGRRHMSLGAARDRRPQDMLKSRSQIAAPGAQSSLLKQAQEKAVPGRTVRLRPLFQQRFQDIDYDPRDLMQLTSKLSLVAPGYFNNSPGPAGAQAQGRASDNEAALNSTTSAHETLNRMT